jgi:hypothetical protein
MNFVEKSLKLLNLTLTLLMYNDLKRLGHSLNLMSVCIVKQIIL